MGFNADEYASKLLGYTKRALETGKQFKHLPLKIAKDTLDLPLENLSYVGLILGYLPLYTGHTVKEIFPLDDPNGPPFGISTEVFVVKMGPIEFATMPGEFFVQTQLYLKSKMSKYGFVIGLAPEELGYIPYGEVFDPTRYEESMCVTSESGIMDGLLTDAIMDMIEGIKK